MLGILGHAFIEEIRVGLQDGVDPLGIVFFDVEVEQVRLGIT